MAEMNGDAPFGVSLWPSGFQACLVWSGFGMGTQQGGPSGWPGWAGGSPGGWSAFITTTTCYPFRRMSARQSSWQTPVLSNYLLPCGLNGWLLQSACAAWAPLCRKGRFCAGFLVLPFQWHRRCFTFFPTQVSWGKNELYLPFLGAKIPILTVYRGIKQSLLILGFMMKETHRCVGCQHVCERGVVLDTWCFQRAVKWGIKYKIQIPQLLSWNSRCPRFLSWHAGVCFGLFFLWAPPPTVFQWWSSQGPPRFRCLGCCPWQWEQQFPLLHLSLEGCWRCRRLWLAEGPVPRWLRGSGGCLAWVWNFAGTEQLLLGTSCLKMFAKYVWSTLWLRQVQKRVPQPRAAMFCVSPLPPAPPGCSSQAEGFEDKSLLLYSPVSSPRQLHVVSWMTR